MRSLGLAAILIWAAAGITPVCAQADRPDTCDGGDAASCTYIVEATRDLTGMLTTSDPTPLRRHLDDRALWISATGAARSGTQLVDAVRNDVLRTTAALDRVSVRFFGEIAVAVWAESWTASGAAVPAGRLTGVDTWARLGGRWRIVTTVENHVPR